MLWSNGLLSFNLVIEKLILSSLETAPRIDPELSFNLVIEKLILSSALVDT